MPFITINYKTTPVSFYRFVCNDPEIKSSYVGHTTNFAERKYGHKNICHNSKNKKYNLKIYQIMRDNGGFENWRMIEIESRLVKDKREAERIEQEWIEKMEADMNSHKAFGGENVQEAKYIYNKEHKEHKREYDIQYCLKNCNKNKVHVECECGSFISARGLTNHKKTLKHNELMKLKIASIV